MISSVNAVAIINKSDDTFIKVVHDEMELDLFKQNSVDEYYLRPCAIVYDDGLAAFLPKE